MSKILYGVGKAVFREFSDETSVIAVSKLKDLSIAMSGSEEKITGGDSPFPFAFFPKDKGVKVSADDAIFNLKGVRMAQGGSISTASVTFTEIEDVEIGGASTSYLNAITLNYKPNAGSVLIDGLTAVTPTTYTATDVNTSVTVGKYAVDVANGKVYVSPADVGQIIDIIYERTSLATTDTLSVLTDSMSKPFKFIHRIPIYDAENNVVANGQFTIYKCRATNAFTLGLKPQTAYTQKLELESMDSGRSDKKVWDWSIETV